jgi:hypothetical protein
MGVTWNRQSLTVKRGCATSAQPGMGKEDLPGEVADLAQRAPVGNDGFSTSDLSSLVSCFLKKPSMCWRTSVNDFGADLDQARAVAATDIDSATSGSASWRGVVRARAVARPQLR